MAIHAMASMKRLGKFLGRNKARVRERSRDMSIPSYLVGINGPVRQK